MHLILLSRIPDRPDALDRLNSFRFPTAAVFSHPMADEMVDGLDAERIEVVRTGYSEPWFPLLPDTEITRQLEREAASLNGRGLIPGPLWVTGPWSTRLPLTFAAAGVEALLIPADRLDVPRSGVVAHLDAVMPVIPVIPAIDRLEGFDGDDAVAVEIGFDELEEAASELAGRPGCDLTTTRAFLEAHRPSGRRRPSIDDWEARFASDPDRFVLHRKLVRLVTRVPDRLSPLTERAVLEAERSAPLVEGRLEVAHRAIIAARVAIDGERRRGDDWLNVSRLDWDADGADEVHVELSTVSMVVAPHRSAAVPTFDMKDPVWPASTVPGEPGWVLCRFTDDGDELEARPIDLTVMRASEVKGGKAELEMTGRLGDGTVTVSVAIAKARLDVGYHLDDALPGQIGPEIHLALGSDVQVRVDGSAPLPIEGPRAVTGHKFRITDGEHQLVLTSLIPCSLFIRPGVEGTGLVAWAHWSTTGSDSHSLTLDLTPPS
jgi:hypothetical protein